MNRLSHLCRGGCVETGISFLASKTVSSLHACRPFATLGSDFSSSPLGGLPPARVRSELPHFALCFCAEPAACPARPPCYCAQPRPELYSPVARETGSPISPGTESRNDRTMER